MTRRGSFRLIAAGFSLIYFAAMGALVTLAMPVLDGVREEALTFVMLPAGTLGMILSVVAHRVRVDPPAVGE